LGWAPRGESLSIPKHSAASGALIRPSQASNAVPLKDDLVKLIAAADRAGEGDVHAALMKSWKLR
jgi:hypothetical protein